MEWNEKKGSAVTKLTLRLAVAGYVLYLMWEIFSGTLDGTSPITPWLSYTICAIFLLAAFGLGFYSFREFRQAIKAPAEIQQNEDTPEVPDKGSKSKD